MKYLILLFLFGCNTEPLSEKYTPIIVNYSGYQNDVLDGVNNARAVNGLPILLPELILTQGAEIHCFYMDSLNIASHDYVQQRADNSKAKEKL